MHTVGVVFFASVLFLPPVQGLGDGKPIAVPAALTGEWVMVAIETDGKRRDRTDDGFIPIQVTVKGDAFTMESSVPFAFHTTMTGTLRVVGTESKVIKVDMTYKTVMTTHKEQKKSDGSSKSLWELMDKDKLRISQAPADGERPTGFDTKLNDQRITWTLQRVKN